jgi:hypothetical protein
MRAKIFDKLMLRAKALEAQFDTEWSDKHPEAWVEFDKMVNDAFDAGQISAEEFDDIVVVGFYDHELKCEY